MASMCATVNEPCSPLTKVSKNFFEVFGDLLSLFVKQLGFLADWNHPHELKSSTTKTYHFLFRGQLVLEGPRVLSSRFLACVFPYGYVHKRV
jgi:hypothetical protein